MGPTRVDPVDCARAIIARCMVREAVSQGDDACSHDILRIDALNAPDRAPRIASRFGFAEPANHNISGTPARPLGEECARLFSDARSTANEPWVSRKVAALILCLLFVVVALGSHIIGR